MKKIKFLKYGFMLVVCLALLCFGMVGSSFKTAFAEEFKSYTTKTNIEKQGDNGFYYAWGTPDHYVLMFQGATSGGGEGWRSLEIYSTLSGSAMHPGSYWGVMVIWVADESGKILLSGEMEKGTNQGDGVNLGVYHQHYGAERDTLLEIFSDGKGESKYPLNREIEISKGDSLVFYCDSGKGKDNSSDSSGCPFTITYTRTDGDKVEGEDLSVYLNAGRPGDVGGFRHVEQEFAADNLEGSVIKTTTIRGGCASSVSSFATIPVTAGIMAILLVVGKSVRRKNK